MIDLNATEIVQEMTKDIKSATHLDKVSHHNCISYRVDLQDDTKAATKGYVTSEDMVELTRTISPTAALLYMRLYELKDTSSAPTNKRLSESLRVGLAQLAKSKRALIEGGLFFEVKASANRMRAHKIYVGKLSVKYGRVLAAQAELVVKYADDMDELDALVLDKPRFTQAILDCKAMAIYKDKK